MKNKVRNKYANKSLKQGNSTFNDYKGNQGYIKVKSKLNIFTLLKINIIIIAMLISVFYVITKYL